MKATYSNISQRASKQEINIDRKQYFHCLLKILGFAVDEISDTVNINYDIRKYEETSDFIFIKDILQPIIDKKLNEIGYTKKKLSSGEIERVEWDGEGLSAERAHKDIMILYNSLMNADKTKWSKDEIDKTLKIIREYDEKFGLFNEDEKEQRKFDSHFYHVYKSFNAKCPKCSKEIDIVRGVFIQCPCCDVWIDTREDKKDFDNDRKMVAGEHGKNSIQQIEGDRNVVIEYKNHYSN